MFDVDDLKIYRGSDIRITDKIIVTQPTIDQIVEFGEKRYFSTVHTLTGVGADFKWQLWDYFNIVLKRKRKWSDNFERRNKSRQNFGNYTQALVVCAHICNYCRYGGIFYQFVFNDTSIHICCQSVC